jgi:putative ABC transport system permease protein
MGDVVQDLRVGLRLLVKDRSFSITALLTLAVCIAANTVIFSVVRSVLLRPLPFPESGRAVLLYNSYPNAGAARGANGVPDYYDRLSAVPALEDQALFRQEGMTFGDESGAERLASIRATPSFFRLVRQQPVAGRIFSEQEGEPGNDRKALLSYGFWQRKFGGDQAVVGRTIRLNGNPYDVVGIMPRTFTFLTNRVDVYVPAAFSPDERSDERRHSNNWQMVGRLAAGASLATVRQQIDALNAANDKRFPNFHQILLDAGFHTEAVMLQDDVVRDVKGMLYLLWGGVLFVLLIGCVNISNLVVVRAGTRTREMATRHAIGGDLMRLTRQLVTETTLLAVVGGVLGVVLGWWALRSISALRLDDLPRGYEIALDPVSLAVLLAMTAGIGVLLGIAPALRLWRMNLNVELRQESRGGTSSRRANNVRRVLAGLQVALALVLLVGAGLLLASFRAAADLDYGFSADGVATAAVNLPQSAYQDDAALRTFVERALEQIRSRPGVEAAGVTSSLPFTGNRSDSVILAEGYTMQPGESLISPTQVMASPGYFEAMKATLVSGRTFDARDTAEAPKVAVIDDRLARKFWPGQDAVGHRLYFPEDINDITRITPETRFYTIVGVVREIQMIDPRADVHPVGAYYLSFAQNPTRNFSFAVRSPAAAGEAGTIRQVVAGLDPQLPAYFVKPMQEWIDDALVGRRVPVLIAGAFGLVALLLSAVGIYGVLAYSVAQRRRELGVRLALGGSSGSVFGLVLMDGVRVVGAGLAVGLVAAFFVGRLMRSQLFEVAPMNPFVLAPVTVLLAVVALVAVAIPAFRASRIDPAIVLGK